MTVANPVIEALGGDPFQPGSPGGEMKCPSCTENTPNSWQPWFVESAGGRTHGLRVEPPRWVASIVSLDYMYCANDDCKELVIRVHENSLAPQHAVESPEMLTRTWNARPRASTRPIDRAVPEPFRTDYLEAAGILEQTPRMSAVLSRKIVFDLLEQYASIAEYTLKKSLDKFVPDTTHPARIRENLQHLREIGDFGAHTQKDGVGQVIEVSRVDAEWTLDLIDGLFDYFIIEPSRHQKLRASWDENLREAKRTAIPPVPPDTEVTSE